MPNQIKMLMKVTAIHGKGVWNASDYRGEVPDEDLPAYTHFMPSKQIVANAEQTRS